MGTREIERVNVKQFLPCCLAPFVLQCLVVVLGLWRM